MDNIEQKRYPNILVISNNPFSKTSNNGKTLASFFKGFPSGNIAQLYFSPQLPDEDYYENYYRISDTQVLKSLFSMNNAGNSVSFEKNTINIDTKTSKVKYNTDFIKRSDFIRLLREQVWKSNRWESDELLNWIMNFSPDIIFFCAGDSGFAYNIVSFVLEKTNSKLITYITDDYILPRRTISLLWCIRRNMIFKKMNDTVKKSHLFVTISEEMRKVYKETFDKDSIIALNMSEPMKINDFKSEQSETGVINLIYAGGLHFKRYETLNILAEAIKEYNHQSYNVKALLSIYSTETPSLKILKKLNIQGVSEYKGALNMEELKIELNKTNILVHVESFDPKSRLSTKLSISTKIPEYLSLGKPILAIGPSEVASMKYLSDCAHCVTDEVMSFHDLKTLLDDEQLKISLSKRSWKKYRQNYSKEQFTKEFIEKVIEIY